MPNRRFDWHEHIKDIEGEYLAARTAVDRLKSQVAADPGLLEKDDRAHLRDADRNLEGTYLVRLFGAFEAALRSYARAWHNDPNYDAVSAILIDSLGGRRGQGISKAVRNGAHAVLRTAQLLGARGRNHACSHDVGRGPAASSDIPFVAA